jgi:hypothetical protein
VPLNKLHVEGDPGGSAGIYLNDAVPLLFDNTVYNNAGILYWNGQPITTGSDSLASGTLAGQTLRWDGTSWDTSSLLFNSGTNIGIGTTSPLAKLHLSGTDTGNDTALYLFNTSAPTSRGWKITAGGYNNYAHYGNYPLIFSRDIASYHTSSFVIQGDSDFVINKSGNVGVGVTNPDSLLTLRGNNQIKFTGVSAQNQITTIGTDGGDNFTITAGLAMGKMITLGHTSYSLVRLSGNQLSLASNFADGRIVFSTGNTERMRVNDLGNVGIGTSAPLNKLHIEGNPGASAGIYLNDAVPLLFDSTIYNNAGTLYWNGQPITTGSDSLASGALAGQTLRWDGASWDTSNLLFNSGANIGIGTTNPSARLDVHGNMILGSGEINSLTLRSDNHVADAELFNIGLERVTYNPGEFSAAITFARGGNAHNASILFKTQNNQSSLTERMRISNLGHVGIGTTNPIYKTAISSTDPTTLSLAHALSPLSGRGPILAFLGDTEGNTHLGWIKAGWNGSSNLDAWMGFNTRTDGGITEKIRITSDGNIGIGTTNPLNKLEVMGDIAARQSSGARVQINAAGGISEFWSSEGQPRWTIHRDLLGAGIPALGFIRSGGTLNGNGVAIGQPGTGTLGLYTSDGASLIERLRINSAGNVGIGTTAPQQTLDVAGNIVLSTGGFIYGNTTTPFIRLSHDGGARLGWSQNTLFEAGSNRISIHVAGTEKFRINSTGNVGIGSTVPLNRLHVEGVNDGSAGIYLNSAVPSTVTNTIYNNAGILYWNGAPITTGSDSIAPGTLAGETLRWDGTTWANSNTLFNTGTNIGIGTTSPLAKLHIDGGTGTLASGLAFGDGSTGIFENSSGVLAFQRAGTIQFAMSGQQFGGWAANSGGIVNVNASGIIPTLLPNKSQPSTGIGSAGENILSLIAGGVNSLNINSSGHVGIGTTAPAAPLHINSASNTLFAIDNEGSRELTLSKGGAGGGLLGLKRGDDHNRVELRYQNADNIGLWLGNGFASPSVFVRSLDQGLSFGTGSQDRLFINQDGHVGLGTTSPLARFDLRADSLSSGTGFNLSSTSTSFSTGVLQHINWSPTSFTNAAGGDLLRISANANASGFNFLNILDNGTSLFSISRTNITANLPTNFTAAGDVTIAYDLSFTNPDYSTIRSSAPLFIQAGEMFGNSDLVLRTFNLGNVVVDSSHLLVNNTATVSGQLAAGSLRVRNNTITGQALVIFNQTENQDILTASASGIPRFALGQDGNIRSAVGASWLPFSDSAQALNIANAAGSSFVTFDSLNNRVGIGTTSPTYLFDVNGTGQIFTGLFGNYVESPSYRPRTTAAPLIFANKGGAELVRFTDSGLVGIGTNDPATQLHIRGEQPSIRLVDTSASNKTWNIRGIGSRLDFVEHGVSSVLSLFSSALKTDIDSLGIRTAGVIRTEGLGNNIMLGNLGIGTTDPASTLEVAGQIRVTRASVDADNAPLYVQQLNPYEDPHNQFVAVFKNSAGQNLWKLRADGRFLSDMNSNVGIGLGSPANSLLFNTTTGTVYSSNIHNFKNNSGADQLTITNSGFVGIGTTSPQQVLHISNNYGLIRFGDNNSAAGTSHAGLQFYSDFADSELGRVGFFGNGHLLLQNSIANKHILLMPSVADGNVGIGTTDPQEKLDLSGRLRLSQMTPPDVTADRLYNVEGNLFWNGIQITGLAGGDLPAGTLTGQTLYWTGGSWSANNTLFNTGTNVGIGTTTPASLFSVGPTSSFRVDEVGNTFIGGNVGIGTTSPSARLDLRLDALTSGTGFNLTSTTTGFTSGAFQSIDWSPISAVTATGGDLLRISANANASGFNFLNIIDNGTSLFSVSKTAITANLPTNFTAAGDVSMAYNLLFTHPNTSNILSNASLNLIVGRSFESHNLTLKTFNSGHVIIDSEALVVNNVASVSGQLSAGRLNVTNTTLSGQALAIFNQTENQDILTASASGAPRFALGQDGNIRFAAGANWLPFSDSAQALKIANAAGSPFVTFNSLNNRVGIGTTSPQEKLHVISSGANDGIRIGYSGDDRNMQLNYNLVGFNGDPWKLPDKWQPQPDFLTRTN